tara:strand:- start:317 stop:451 length:135 start_codon:yes stop_codon:yes gene_type:complete
MKATGIIEAIKPNKVLKGKNIEPVFHICPMKLPLEKIEDSVRYL